MLPRVVKNIYNVLNNGSFDEYRYFKHQVRSLKFIQKDLIDYRNCPLCPQTGELGVAIHSMDACFGLTRKKLARNSFAVPNHGCLKFADQDEVDDFVDQYSKSNNKSCQIFKAGEVTEALHSKGKNQLFDEKGVFGSCCSRHSHLGRFFSTKYGERQTRVMTFCQKCQFRCRYFIVMDTRLHARWSENCHSLVQANRQDHEQDEINNWETQCCH
ncbi:uncharacterized protein LOC124455119 isoform X2 [Xenia sp. Carnegie-2017]|uniref:uncharacterized protein LOC124455119 isoform X2 n=1 Tax=Xenia sp. Carnegie-2017 TaxID=2897299 RepID=UPI001F0487CA|nr:uncharacterized protein LOC124455119 isoform X2 [Xenia sp. Carnegie-2017]